MSVDKSSTTTLHIPYAVMTDVTMLTPGDIPVDDANSYQFFAFSGVVFPRDAVYQVRAFAPPTASAIDLPYWITNDDVKRAAMASDMPELAVLSTAGAPMDLVLTEKPSVQGLFLRMTADDARLPITMARAAQGVNWDVSDVPLGVYTIAAYIWSPPYNGWAIRPGVIKVRDAEHDVPAGAIDAVHETVFSYQGRKVHACFDVPERTRLDAYVSVEERPEEGWIPWLTREHASTGTFDVCFHHPRPELTGSLHLRFDLTGPDGRVTTLHAPDTITALVGTGACDESDTLCCAPREADAGAAGSGSAGAVATGDDAGAHAEPKPAAKLRPSGCNIQPGARAQPLAPMMFMVLFLIARRIRLRLSRRAPARPRGSTRGSYRSRPA